ncbi:hypothetical protein SLS62_005620 [Diatrype stigma]|uniref:Uncharacterized protein n=1 Tax=Diatrype stigma TaxID=117547 RepID=A0AAN9USG4_9PEZI
MPSATSERSVSNHSTETLGVVGSSRGQAAAREQDDDYDDDRDAAAAEDLALSSPERSPAPSSSGHHSSSINSDGRGDADEDGGDGPGGTDDAVGSGINAVKQQDQQQPTVPYIKTLEEIYRVVDSLTNSPVDAAGNNIRGRHRESHHHNHQDSFNDKPDANPDSDSDIGHYDGYNSGDDDDGFYDIPIPRAGPDATCPACATPYDVAAADPLFSTSTLLHHRPHQRFRSTLHLLYNDPLKHTWALGSRLVVTETDGADDSQPGGPEVALAEAARMLRATTRVPVPAVLAAWKEADGRVVTVCERVGGGGGGGDGGGGRGRARRTRRLYDVWWELTAVERERLARRVAGYAEQWRRNYSDAISSISGYPIVRGYETLLGSGRGVCFGGDYNDDGGGGGGVLEEESGTGFPHCRSDIEFWGAIEERLLGLRRRRRKPKEKTGGSSDEDEDTMSVLREYMPESYPCVLTHGDLSTRNVLVEMRNYNGNGSGGGGGGGTGVEVAAILGFENAASLPVWAEGVCARFCYCREDEQWKALLSRYLPSGNPAAFDWWRLWRAVRGDGDDAAAIDGNAKRSSRINEARVRMLKERCRRWPKPPEERRAFNTARTEPGARQVPRREPATAAAAAEDGDEDGRAKDSPTAARPLREEEEGDVSAGLGAGDYRSRRETLDPSTSLGRPVFNPEPIRFSDPEHNDEEDASGDIASPVDGDRNKPEESPLAEASEPYKTSTLRERDVRGRQLEKDDEDLSEQVQHGKERPLDGKQTELRDKRATWHTSRAMGSNGSLSDRHNSFTEPNNTSDGMDLAEGSSSLGRSKDTSPNPNVHRPALTTAATDTHTAERDQRTRGRPRQRNSTTVKRTSMRSFGPQVTLQPFTLQPLSSAVEGRPHSLPPVVNAISAADMEKLRNIGENDSNDNDIDNKNSDDNDGQGSRDVVEGLGGRETEERDAPSNTNTNKHARDTLPIIQESPATPRRPMVQGPSGGGGGGRVRPASLYGTLQAWGQKNRGPAATAGTGSSANDRSGAHKRARSEVALLRSNPSSQPLLRPHRTTINRAPLGGSGPGRTFVRPNASSSLGKLAGLKDLLKVSEEVKDALATNKPVVALESTIYTHGAIGDLGLEEIVRQHGGVPAVVGILDGVPTVGLLPDDVTRMIEGSAMKVSRRDIAYLVGMGMMGQKIHGGTTIAGTMILARLAGIRVFGTGGLGGVHRGGHVSMDISADLTELGRTRMAVIASGCKGFLDIPRTLEYLETQGVYVSTFADGRRSNIDFPTFWARDSGIRSPSVVDTEEQAAAIILAQEKLNIESGLLFANPIPEEFAIPRSEMDAIIEQAVRESSEQGAVGHENTPFILRRIRDLTDGRSVTANKFLVQANVERATKIAVAVSRLISGDLALSSEQ